MTQRAFLKRQLGFAVVVAGMASFVGCASTAMAQSEREVRRTLEIEEAGDEDESIIVRIENGDVYVEVDGEEIDEDRIRQERGRVIIVDEGGDVIHEIKLHDGHDRDHARRHIRRHLGKHHEDIARVMHGFEHPDVMLGIQMSSPGPALEHHFGLEKGTTTLISGVYEGLPAHSAGLGQYDIITKVDGSVPANGKAIVETLREKEAGETVTLTVIQKGETKEFTVTLVEHDREAMSESKLLGHSGRIQNWFHEGDFENFDWNEFVPAPEFRHDVFVVPDEGNLRKRIEVLAPRIAEQVRERYSDLMDNRDELEDNLERLEGRLEDLERMLEELLERQN